MIPCLAIMLHYMFSGENGGEGEGKKTSCHLTKNAEVIVMYSLDALQCPASLRNSGISLSSWQTTNKIISLDLMRVFPPHMCFFTGCFLTIYFYFAFSLVICAHSDVFLNGGGYLWSLKWPMAFPWEENECHPLKILPHRGAHTTLPYHTPQISKGC